MFNVSAPNVTQGESVDTCPSRAVTLSLALVTFVTGFFGNAAVISFIRAERRVRKKPNLILLYNMSVNNLIALLTSLMLHLALNELKLWDRLPLKFANILCALKPILLYIYLKVGLLTLTAICVDRYEMFVRMTKPKILTKARTKKFVIASWVVAIFTTTLACYGYFQNAFQPQIYCERNPHFVYGQTTKHSRISERWVIADVAVWITLCNMVDIFSLSSVGRMLTRHMEGVKTSLGTRKALREVKMVKMAAYVFLAYVVFWLPYGIVALLILSSKNPSRPMVCFYSLAQTTSYAIFGAIAFIYIGTNKRVLRQTLETMRKPVERFSSVSGVKLVTVRSRRKTVGSEFTSDDTERKEGAPSTLEKADKTTKRDDHSDFKGWEFAGIAVEDLSI